MISGKSESVISKTMVMDVAPGWCGERPIPEGYTLVDIDEQLNEALNSDSANSAMNSPELAEAMQQASEAMAQMTPEQQEMMASFGLDNLLGGAVATGGPAASADPAASPKSKTSSAELTTDDLLESVQKHLAALGYNPGNTDGTTSVMTEVAISQFQAENGLAVTGKVTPQLLGILSAKVDSR
jgi:hypothetical protein